MRAFPYRRHPGTAALCNVVVPGLGFVYLGRWGLALLNVLLYFVLQLVAGTVLLFVITRFYLQLSPILTLPFAVLIAYISGRWAMHEAIRMRMDGEPEEGGAPSVADADTAPDAA